MHHRSTAGRRRAPKAPWHARLRTTLAPQLAVKSMAALGVSAATVAAVVVPAEATPSSVTATRSAAPANVAAVTAPVDGAATLSAAVAQARMETFLGASRSTDRISLAADEAAPESAVSPNADPAAVVSPEVLAPTVAGVVGVTGIEAVAKPAAETNLDAAAATPGAAAAPEAPAGYSTSAYFSMCRSKGLGASAARTCSAVRSLFGPLTIGGYRAGDGDHGAGVAVDVMITSRAQGDEIAAWLQAHAGELNIKYLIWRQRYWPAGGSWRMMADRGSPTQNHMDHVHITVR